MWGTPLVITRIGSPEWVSTAVNILLKLIGLFLLLSVYLLRSLPAVR